MGRGRKAGEGGLIIILCARDSSASKEKEERETGTQDYVTIRNLYSICPHALTMFIKVPIYRGFSDERYGGSRVGATLCPHS